MTPIMPVLENELVAYVGRQLLCHTSSHQFTAGRVYPVRLQEYQARSKGVILMDSFVHVLDDTGRMHRFMPNPQFRSDHTIATLWSVFNKPVVPTVAELFPELLAENLAKLEMFEQLHGFDYMPGQRDMIARLGIKDSAIVAGETGTGKSLIALSLIQIKEPKRALIVGPQGTVKGSRKTDIQWREEINLFCPNMPVFQLFSRKDWLKLADPPPFGIYLTYYEAYLRAKKGLHTLSELTGDWFDFVALDEVHKIGNLDSLVTQAAIKLQPKYRFGFSATPINDTIINLFPLLGWAMVPGWGTRIVKSQAWPFTRHDLGAFVERFMALKVSGKSEKFSPVLSYPAELSKLIKPACAYISKKACSPDYKEPTVIEHRVLLGTQQMALYKHYLNLQNISGRNAMERAGKRSTFLRNICADPKGFRRRGPRVLTNMNPKTLGVMEITMALVKRGDPVIIVCARTGQSDTFHALLNEAGVKVSRIDSTILARRHAEQSQLFKRHKTQVHIMGYKSAVAHSYSECPNEIVASVEWSPGGYSQVVGRFDRLNSRYDRTLHVVLNRHSIEEIQYDRVGLKGGSAMLLLSGTSPADLTDEFEVEAHFKPESVNESECEAQWTALCTSFK